ncbi:MAG: ZIP family metal transporter [Thermoproteota archaeon]|nr:ZIP family metal transporter [Thermoproteota archaeon]
MVIQDLMTTISSPDFTQSIILGIVVASAFPIGAAVAIARKFPKRIKGNLAAIAAGIYFSTLAFSLIEEAIKVSSFPAMAAGFAIGAVSFSIAHPVVKERKELTKIFSLSSSKKKEEETSDNDNKSRSRNENKEKHKQQSGSSSAGEMNIVGTVLDSLPENLFLGAILALNLSGLLAASIALFLGNLTATMDGAQRMFEKGMQRSKIFKRWIADFLIVAPAGVIGLYLVKPLGEAGVGGIIGFAAGALLVFVTVDLIPKAYSEENWHIGLSTTLGLIAVLAIFHYLG